MQLRVLSAEEVAEYHRLAELDSAVERERRALVEVCKASETGHDWWLDLDHPEDDTFVSLRCSWCPAGVDDVYPDGWQMIFLEHEGVAVVEGKHNAPEAMSLPVTVDVRNWSHWTDYGYEYDAELIIEPLPDAHWDLVQPHPLVTKAGTVLTPEAEAALVAEAEAGYDVAQLKPLQEPHTQSACTP